MILKLTLTPNRATGPRRGVRIIAYRRIDDAVFPYLYQEDDQGRASADEVPWRSIRREWQGSHTDPYPADPELAREWREHVQSQQ